MVTLNCSHVDDEDAYIGATTDCKLYGLYFTDKKILISDFTIARNPRYFTSMQGALNQEDIKLKTSTFRFTEQPKHKR
ncbi:MAG: hypothetical protein IPL23_02590 [Saprospiraceae bacterium]|nr:hypothetical protein [Saprospiraceae bacterium]